MAVQKTTGSDAMSDQDMENYNQFMQENRRQDALDSAAKAGKAQAAFPDGDQAAHDDSDPQAFR